MLLGKIDDSLCLANYELISTGLAQRLTLGPYSGTVRWKCRRIVLSCCSWVTSLDTTGAGFMLRPGCAQYRGTEKRLRFSVQLLYIAQ